MPIREPNLYLPTGQVSAAELQRLARTQEEQNRVTGGVNTNVGIDSSGVRISEVRPVEFYARITARSDVRYAWIEQTMQDVAGVLVKADDPDGRVGTVALMPAYEHNGKDDVAVDTVVLMRHGHGDYMIFGHPCPQTRFGLCPVVDAVANCYCTDRDQFRYLYATPSYTFDPIACLNAAYAPFLTGFTGLDTPVVLYPTGGCLWCGTQTVQATRVCDGATIRRDVEQIVVTTALTGFMTLYVRNPGAAAIYRSCDFVTSTALTGPIIPASYNPYGYSVLACDPLSITYPSVFSNMCASTTYTLTVTE